MSTTDTEPEEAPEDEAFEAIDQLLEEEKETFLEHAASVFHNISLLSIKRSFRLLCSMESQIIENFVEKYSDFIIFLLNILDRRRSNELLERLTDASLVYISEEELRTLMIREVATLATAGKDFTDISLFLDCIDRPGENPELQDFTRSVVSLSSELRKRPQKRNFAYLDTLGEERLAQVLERVLRRNYYVGLGLLLFCSDRVLCVLLDQIVQNVKHVIGVIPHEIYLIRFQHGWRKYAPNNIEVYQALPRETQDYLAAVQALVDREELGLASLRSLFAQETEPVSRRKKVLEKLSTLVQHSDLAIMDVAFVDLVDEGIVDEKDLLLLRSVMEQS